MAEVVNEECKKATEEGKTAFNFGYEVYYSGLAKSYINIKNDVLAEQAYQGYEMGRLSKVKVVGSDIIKRKWLTIKGRCIGFRDFDLTESSILKILRESKGRCPVTHQKLTFGETVGTDWSIDRIDNSQGYLIENIIVLSASANSAKDDLDYEGVIRTATNERLRKLDPKSKLSQPQWHEMARVFYHRMEHRSNIPFCEMIFRANQYVEIVNFIIIASLNCKKTKLLFAELEKHIPKNKLQKKIKATLSRNKRVMFKMGRINSRKSISESKNLRDNLKDMFHVMLENSEVFDKLMMDAFYSNENKIYINDSTLPRKAKLKAEKSVRQKK